MRLALLLAVLMVLTGCKGPQRIDRSTLDQRYQSTQLADGVVSIMPKRLDSHRPAPVVVNWWYAGSSGGQHEIVYRDLTWDSTGKPVGNEARYRIAADQLKIALPFELMREASRWVPLYEAAPDEIEPPADLPTARKAPQPIETNPIRQPDETVFPKPD